MSDNLALPREDPDLARLAASSRRSAIVSALSFALIIGSLAYSSYKLYRAHNEVAALEARKAALTAETEKIEIKLAAERRKAALLTKVVNVTGSQNNEQAKVVKEAIERAIEATPGSAQITPRVYVHIKDEAQRPKAKQIAAKLQSLDYIVPGIEYVGTKAPGVTQLRYFRNEPEELADVKSISDALKGFGLQVETVSSTGGHDRSTSVRRRHYELWFGANF